MADTADIAFAPIVIRSSGAYAKAPAPACEARREGNGKFPGACPELNVQGYREG